MYLHGKMLLFKTTVVYKPLLSRKNTQPTKQLPMKQTITFLIFFLCFTQTGKSQAEIYSDEDIHSYIINHQKIAILPMDVTVRDLKPAVRNRMTEDEIYELEEEYRSDFQYAMHAWLLKQKKKGKIRPEIQDAKTTNELLEQHHIYTKDDLSRYRYDEIANLLGVDAVFAGKIITTSTFSRKAAAVWAIVLEEDYTTGNADISLTLYDKLGDRLWSYNNVLFSDFISSQKGLVHQMMRQVARRFPY